MATTRPPKDKKSPVRFNAKLPLAEQVLAHARTGREVVQDFCPLAESLEWELGQQYLRDRGNQAFLGDTSPVPFVINNDGTLSHNAAEVFFANLVEAERGGTLEDEIFVLELGIGVGLFARFFLDHFRDLCRQHNKDFYDRLCYIAADLSERMLLDVLRHGVLSEHRGHFRVRVINALEPEKYLPRDVMFRKRKGNPIHAVFLNYLLDCLPAAVLEFQGEQVKQLCVRTCVARSVNLPDRTDLSPAMLREWAASKDPNRKQELLEVYGLFASEYDFRPVDLQTLPYGEFAVRFAKPVAKRIVHSFGAMQCLEKLLDLIHPEGFVLMNEYGLTKIELDQDIEHQRFSLATAMGINFPLLEHYFGTTQKRTWLAPSGDEERGIHTRLLGHQVGHGTRVRFQEVFQLAAFKDREAEWEKARACLKAGRFEMAATCYDEALKRQPRNWVLLNEVSSFLTFQLRDPKAGIDMAKVALALNPTCSSELWNTLGEGLFEFGRTTEARSAFQKALAINANDVRAHCNLVWVYARDQDYPAALEKIAKALALDKTGDFRERLLQKQSEVLTRLAISHQQEYLLLANLVSKFGKQEDKDKTRPDEPGGMPSLPRLSS